MPRRIAVNTLNASTIDILNVIRQNASYDYQQNVPAVVTEADIPKVGEVIYGTPAFANQFINALVNRIAIVRTQSVTFNNPYSFLKKGYLEFGETVEDIFVSIAKAVDFSAEKASAREFKRTFPDIKSAFHVMNFRAMYPVTIQDEDLKQAFLSIDGVSSLIAKIVDSVYTAAEYDEFLLFKYMLIKSISHGKMYPLSIGSTDNTSDAAKKFRTAANLLPFMSANYNSAGVKTTTPKDRQVIFMDAEFNAKYDVDVLSSAFNMDRAEFIGRLCLIDDFTSFDNERFDVIREASDGIEEVTDAELALMANVKAVLLDENWFQFYDNNNKFTEKYVASGLYWNYFYHTWKTISYSPFANAVVFVTDAATITPLEEITFEIIDKSTSDIAVTITLQATDDTATLKPSEVRFMQTEALTTAGIAVHPYGALMIPAGKKKENITLVVDVNGTTYTASTTITSENNIGDRVTAVKG